MANNLSPELLAQIFYQQSDDPFLTLVTLSHANFSPVRLVNNSENIISRGETFLAFPFKIRLPMDDGESVREVKLEIDNVSLELIDEIRTATTPVDVKIEMILASIPDEVQIALEELKIQSVSYNSSKITARLFMDSFLSTSMNAETYTPTNYPALF